jgi:hypothetical protein
MIRTAMVLVASLVVITPGQTADKPKEGPVGLERELQGMWKGPACGGDWTFGADATFAVKHYSPGNNQLTGSWEVRWNALPPTLVLTVKTSDAPERIKVGETWEVKLVQLNDEALAYEWPQKPGQAIHWTRVKK